MKKRNEVSENFLVNGGVYLIEPDFLNNYQCMPPKNCSLEDDILPDILSKEKRVAGFLANGTFIDIGVPEDYQRAAQILSKV